MAGEPTGEVSVEERVDGAVGHGLEAVALAAFGVEGDVDLGGLADLRLLQLRADLLVDLLHPERPVGEVAADADLLQHAAPALLGAEGGVAGLELLDLLLLEFELLADEAALGEQLQELAVAARDGDEAHLAEVAEEVLPQVRVHGVRARVLHADGVVLRRLLRLVELRREARLLDGEQHEADDKHEERGEVRPRDDGREGAHLRLRRLPARGVEADDLRRARRRAADRPDHVVLLAAVLVGQEVVHGGDVDEAHDD
mmetsp:Transcript_23260/g.72716  ORF Transcript_23260/g.72716 Transcript_23260/m.72716 type:complete len:257 (-) Transcript_23260:449-1219(-)